MICIIITDGVHAIRLACKNRIMIFDGDDPDYKLTLLRMHVIEMLHNDGLIRIDMNLLNVFSIGDQIGLKE